MLVHFVKIDQFGADQMINSIYNFVSIMNFGYISEDETVPLTRSFTRSWLTVCVKEAIHSRVYPYYDVFQHPMPHQKILENLAKIPEGLDNSGKPYRPEFSLAEYEQLWKKTQNEPGQMFTTTHDSLTIHSSHYSEQVPCRGKR